MRSEGVSWSDIGNVVERGFKYTEPELQDGGKFTEQEMQEFGQAVRAEAIEAGIAIGLARGGNSSGKGNGHLTLPGPAAMAEYCHARLGQMKDDKQRDFVSDMYVVTRRGARLSPGRLGYLTSIYIQIGGKT